MLIIATLVPIAWAGETVCGKSKGLQILRDASYTKRGNIEIPFIFFNVTDYIASAWYYVEIMDGDGEVIVAEEGLIEDMNSRMRDRFALSIPAHKASAIEKIECDITGVQFRVDPVRQEFNRVRDKVGFRVEVTGDAVELRPHINSIDSLETIPGGTILTVTGRDLWQSIKGPDHAEWYKVSVGDKTGWISEKTCRRLQDEE